MMCDTCSKHQFTAAIPNGSLSNCEYSSAPMLSLLAKIVLGSKSAALSSRYEIMLDG